MTFTKCHYRAIRFYIVGFDTGKTGNTKVGQKGYFFKPALLEDEELTGSVNRKENNDAQFSDINGLQVTILSSNSGLKNVVLPWPPKGSYFFDSTDALHLGKFLSVREERGKWTAHCMKPAFIRNIRGEVCYQIELMHGGICWLENADDTYALYTEFSNRKTNIFHNYRAQRFTDITIGRTPENDIQYSNSFVSRHHAILYWDKNNWIIRDNGSTNGLYVNNMRVEKAALHTGDSIFIMGLRINIGIGFLSINDENGRIRFSSKLRRITENDRNMFPEKPYNHSHSEELFNRLPRKREALNPEPIIIEAPPMKINDNGIPLVLRMGGSMVMSSAALLAGNITSMISSVFFPVLTQKYTKKQKEEYEAKRQEKYRKYLIGKKALIEKEVQYEKRILAKNYQELSQILLYAEDGKRLWERRVVDDDFLEIRIGYGRIPMLAERRYPERRFEMDEDNLLDLMYELAERPYFLEDAPIMTSFIENYVSGVTGSHNLVIAFMKRLIMQLTILHSYEEMKLVILGKEDDLHCIRLVRFLPHIWNDQKDFRFLATSTAEASQISEYLKNELETDIQSPRELKKILKERPYYVVIAFDKKIFDSMEIFKDVMKCDKSCGISVITAFDELPKECMNVYELHQSGKHSIVHLNQIENPDSVFQMDECSQEEVEHCLKIICNTSLRVVSQAYSLPKMVTFLEMYGVGNVEQLNPKKRWSENNPLKSLSAPIGIATDGSLFTLDLHEKCQGPHGLIAGMTGSGKSEFIITYILSLAVNYSPEEVAFILIDYKGGGLAGAFEDEARGIHLPHLVGTITNLDGNAIHRAMMALQSELKRRQRIFNEAKTIADEGTMDIYGYQRLYRNGKVKEPLPHLFVISDEFAELKAQEPDFMDDLISTARIGRSLGVHLILATQKPAGVVDDQINSNSKFRVCLKVQTRADSDDMLRRPDAAEIKETGRFYLQVGFNEFFAYGQSAWCGAAYEPQDKVIVHRDDVVQFIDGTGQSVVQVKPEVKNNDSGITQLVAIVKYLSRFAEKEEIAPRKLWLDPMPDIIKAQSYCRLSEDERKEGLSIVAKVALIDDTENQTQLPLILDFQKSQNLMIVGTAKTGKTTVVETLLYSLMENYTPEDVNYYILDYAGRMLSVFNHTPFCGGVWGEGDEKEAEKLFQMLEEIISERKTLFFKAAANSFEAYLEVEKIPMIFVVIDNVIGLRAWEKGDAIYYKLNQIMRDGNYVGIKFVITAASEDDIYYSIRQELDLRLVLSAKNRYEYGDILGLRSAIEPSRLPGRGMCKYNDRALEMQIVRYTVEGSERKRVMSLKEYVENQGKRHIQSKPARKIQVVDETETYESFCADIPLGRIPLGYSVSDAKKISIPLKQLQCMTLYFGNPTGVLPVMTNYISAAVREHMHFIIVKGYSSVFDTETVRTLLADSASNVTTLSCTTEDSDRFVECMIEEVNYRKEYRNRFCEANGLSTEGKDTMKLCGGYICNNTYPLMVIFEDIADFCKNASDACHQVMRQIMNNGIGYNYYFIACYYPESDSEVDDDSIHISFNPDRFVLLYGGQFDKQDLVSLPYSYRDINKPSRQYNNCLMQYHGGLYPVLTPCGNLNKRTGDPDDEEIIM